MKNVFAITALGFLLSMSAQAQAKPDVKPPVAAPAPTPKVAPIELLKAFDEWSTLNQVVAKIKADDGIPKLEQELESRRLGVLALAAKNGFHYDPATSTFVEDAPKVEAKPAAPEVKK